MASTASKPVPGGRSPSHASAYAIFEGGGAKGIGHVGAYRAMDKAGLALRGVAGASAGAIFAALVAVGYTADEIFEDADKHILTALNVGSPVGLIGERKWGKISSMKSDLAWIICGIVASTVFSTMLGAIVIVKHFAPYADALELLLASAAVALLAGRLTHRFIYGLKALAHLAIAATIIAAAVLLRMMGLAPDWFTVVLGGLAIGFAIFAAIRDAPILFLLCSGVALLLAISLRWGPHWPGWVVPSLLFVCMLGTAVKVLGWARPILTQQGLVTNHVVQDAVNKALLAKLEKTWDQATQGPLPEIVCFKHIEPNPPKNDFIQLKLVTTNIDEQRLTIIDRHHPDVAVGQAVAASAALPLVFCPATIDRLDRKGFRYADGGLISNMPSWIFRDEKRQLERWEANQAREFRRIPIFAIALDTNPDKTRQSTSLRIRLVKFVVSRKYFLIHYLWEFIKNPKHSNNQIMRIMSSVEYFMRLIDTAIFGSQSVVKDFISDLHVIQIKVGLKTMQLDCSGEEAKAAIDDAERQALDWFERESQRDRLTMITLKDIREKMAAEMAENLKNKDLKPEDLRVVLLDPLTRGEARTPVALQVKHVLGGDPERNTDDELELDLRGSIAAEAFNSKRVAYGQFDGIGAGPLWMTKYEHALLPRQLKSSIAIPISSIDGQVERVISVDSHVDMLPQWDNAPFNERLIALCIALRSDLFNQSLEGLLNDS